MKLPRFAVILLALAGLTAVGFAAVSSGKATTKASDGCCSGDACCTAGASCCSK